MRKTCLKAGRVRPNARRARLEISQCTEGMALATGLTAGNPMEEHGGR
ncbi:MAG: hypothetical protein QY305_13250 [Candidatus Brocadiaceae baterium WH-1]|nr:MAG: hypothetical protein QY305_13250 [Candidatus Jettenia sp. AMX2]